MTEFSATTFEEMVAKAPAWHCVAEQFWSPAGQPPLTVKKSATLAEVTDLLADRGFMSVPVVADNGALEGVVSVWDIITGLRVAIETAPVHDFGHVAPAYLQQTVESIVRPTITLPHSVTLTKLIEFFASGTQHVFLVDDEDKIVAVATQSAAARFLAPFLSLSLQGIKTLKELDFDSTGSVTAIRDSKTVLEGLQAITGHQLTALAVVDGKGKLVGNLSARDFLGIRPIDFELLMMDIKSYLSKVSPRSLEPATCSQDDNLYRAVHRMVKEGIYRLWLVDDSGRPTSVLSYTDVFNILHAAQPTC